MLGVIQLASSGQLAIDGVTYQLLNIRTPVNCAVVSPCGRFALIVQLIRQEARIDSSRPRVMPARIFVSLPAVLVFEKS